MEILWQELSFGFPEHSDIERFMIRLIAAALLGLCIGAERQRAGKSAGVRTHMLVTVGTTAFLLACIRYGMTLDGVSRVIQGIVTGIGFIGAGTILKLEGANEVKGLTTSAGIWMAAAVGVAVGLGALGLAVMTTGLALIILTVTVAVDNWINKGRLTKKPNVSHHKRRSTDIEIVED
jgi:putative Mg2+ transporter-C (MgtC) family protein